jgi:hypothetical protein
MLFYASFPPTPIYISIYIYIGIGLCVKTKKVMTLEELLDYYAYLGPDQSKWNFAIAMELGLFFSRGTMEDIKERELINNYIKIRQMLAAFTNEWLHKCSRKTRKQPYDLEFHTFLDNMVQKGAENWTEDDTKEIVRVFDDICGVEFNGDGVSGGLHTYNLFQQELLKRYVIDPKLKYYLDPEVVVVDLPETHAAAINAAIAAFIPNPSLAALPNKDNISSNPFVWSFGTFAEANWWMGYLKGRIPTANLMYFVSAAPVSNYN